MKKVLLLLYALCISEFAFPQYNNLQNEFAFTSHTASKPVEDVFIKFEDLLFTQSNKKEIIASYLKLGKTHKDLGHLEEASSFLTRAYVLAKDYYPDDKNPFKRINNIFQSVLAPLILSLVPKEKYIVELEVVNNLWLKPDEDSIKAIPYLRKAIQVIPNKEEEELITYQTQTNTQTAEHKTVASFFVAATEPVNEEIYTLIKRTSLRKKATHKSRVQKRLAVGTKLLVLEKQDKYWWKVETDGVIGYVKALLLK